MPGNSTARSRNRKSLPLPKKPYAGFPLTPHASGKWQTKIRGTTFYFGLWYTLEYGKKARVLENGWQEAVAEYDRVKADLHAGRTPGQTKSNELTVGGLCHAFLSAKSRRLKAGELSQRMWQDYRQVCDLLVAQFGAKRLVDDLAPADFGDLRDAIASRCEVVRRKNEILRVRSVFKFGVKNRLLDRPVEFGTEFDVPDLATLRRHRAASDRTLFEATELRLILDVLAGDEVTISTDKEKKKIKRKADPAMRAAVLLPVNAGCGNTDLSDLQQQHLDLDSGWLDFPRGRTGIGRRVPLWKENMRRTPPGDQISTRGEE